LITKQFAVRGALDWPLSIIFIQICITCLIVPDLSFSLPKVMGALFGIAVYYALFPVLKNEKLIKTSIFTFLGGGVLFSLVSFLGMKTLEKSVIDLLVKIRAKLPQMDFRLPGAEEGFHPNAIGGTLILIIPLFLIFLYSTWKRKGTKDLLSQNRYFSTILLLGTVVVTAVLLFSQSRSSIIGLLFGIGVLIFGIIQNRKIRKAYVVLFLIVSLSFLVSFFIIFIEGEKLPSKLPEITMRAASRTEAWAAGLEIARQKPLTGIGMNHLRRSTRMPHGWTHAHNHFVHTAAEMGIPALIALLALLAGAGALCVQIWKKAPAMWMKMTALGLAAGQLSHLVFGIFDSIPLGAKPGIFFWLSLALITALHNYVSIQPEKK
jgi:O-antigen ligase